MARKSSAPAKKAPRAPSTDKIPTPRTAEEAPTATRKRQNKGREGSTPSTGTNPKARSSAVEHGPDKALVAGSTPAAPTTPSGNVATPPAGNVASESTSGRADVAQDPLATLPPIEQRFVLEYLKDFNGTQAYIRVKPGTPVKTAGTMASRLLAKVEVQAALQAARARIVERMELTSERVLREVARLAFFDPRKFFDEKGNVKAITELDDDTASALAGFEVFEEYEGKGENRVFVGYTKKFKLSDRKAALDMAMRHLGEYEKHNKQIADPLKALLDGMQRSTLPIAANPPADEDA